jgi:hypothetical protein
LVLSDFKVFESLERAKGVEPSSLAWEARVMPLYDARVVETAFDRMFSPAFTFTLPFSPLASHAAFDGGVVASIRSNLRQF